MQQYTFTTLSSQLLKLLNLEVTMMKLIFGSIYK
jgi:hypothetical protein